MFFDIVSIETIMDEFEYPGVRIHMEAKLDKLKQPIKIDVSTDDVITPRAVEHNYQLMFEDREIDLLSYNVETILAEKAQTILSRGLANTRMRDFYDVFELIQRRDYSKEVFKNAFRATCLKRGTELGAMQIQKTLETIASSNAMETMWNRFGNSNYYVEEVAFDKVVAAVESLLAIELLQ